MSKKKVLSEIKEFREAFNKIKPEEFYFDQFVKELNEDRTCGTVCCLWGWIPQIAPEIAARYDLKYDYFKITDMSHTPHVLNWPYKIISYLFYPNAILSPFTVVDKDSSLSDVLQAWDKVIDTLENTTRLDYYFKTKL